jgi:hypothetical protein
MLEVKIERRTHVLRNQIDALPDRPRPLQERVAGKLIRQTAHPHPAQGGTPA